MGDYVNPGSDNFEMSLATAIFVDKSELIRETNKLFRTRQRFICLSRPRRFGKTMALEMLATYYGLGETKHLFDGLNIAKDPSYEKHLNKYNVIMVNVQEFLSQADTVEEMLGKLQRQVVKELLKQYPEVEYDDVGNFIQVMKDTFRETKRPFVILLDEWDCLFREYKQDLDSQKTYLDFLRLWLKDQSYVGLAYMTGILPVKKYGTHSALNMFWEYSMTEPSQFINHFGFTTEEVKALCLEHGMDFERVKTWYNGYFKELGNPIYNPTSTVQCLERKTIANYWNRTETYEALKDYVALNYDGLKEKITEMIGGASIPIHTGSFVNDMTTFKSADDILTLLVHLGYLSYHLEEGTVRIPNEEIKSEFLVSVTDLKWHHVLDSIKQSDKLLKAIWEGDADFVAQGIQKVHEQNTSILAYNDENALASILGLALYTAKDYYSLIREFPTGKGYADLVLLPRKYHSDKPAIVVELKYGKSVSGAIEQIKTKNYVSALEEYKGDLLLVGINYDKADKVYECLIEPFSM